MPTGVRSYPELTRKRIGGQNKLKLKGKRFGRLKVWNDTGQRDAAGHVIWLCTCRCGNKRKLKVASSDLKRGHSTSCKCYNRERSGRWNAKCGRLPKPKRKGR